MRVSGGNACDNAISEVDIKQPKKFLKLNTCDDEISEIDVQTTTKIFLKHKYVSALFDVV